MQLEILASQASARNAAPAHAMRRKIASGGLLQQQSFAHLIASHKSLRRAELPENIQNLAILKYARMHGQRRSRHQFDCLRIHNLVTIKSLRRAAVKRS